MAALPDVYHALGNPIRLEIIDRLSRTPEMTTLELLSELGASRQAATKHLVVLERAGVVRSKAKGSKVMRRLEPSALAEARTWLAKRSELWSEKLEALAAYVEEG